MSDKLFTLAGVSTLKGVKTMRFATGKTNVRTGVLKRNGHTDIALFDLPKPMSKLDAAAWLKDEKQIADAVLPAAKKADRSQKAKDKRAEKEKYEVAIDAMQLGIATATA